MKIKYNKSTLTALHNVLEEVGYKVRYEKGNFKSGYCLVEKQKIAVVNKFFDTKARINSLLDILSLIDVNKISLGPEDLSFLNAIEFNVLSLSE